jgi:uncharacterized protein (TIGR03067 family)
MRVSGLVGLVALVAVVVSLRAGEAAKLDPAKLAGTYTYVSGEEDGNKLTKDHLKGTVEITKETITLKSEEAKFVIKYKLDSAKKPCRIAMQITEGPAGQGSKADGIIELKGDRLRLCYPAAGGAAPKEFAAPEGSKLHFFVLKRKK